MTLSNGMQIGFFRYSINCYSMKKKFIRNKGIFFGIIMEDDKLQLYNFMDLRQPIAFENTQIILTSELPLFN